MGIISSIKNFIGMDDELLNDELDYEYEEETQEEKPRFSFGSRFESAKKSTGNEQITIIRPQEFADAPKIADVLKSKRSVIFDVSEITTHEEAGKVVDFISGAVYALGGDIKLISGGIFIAVPENVDIDSSRVSQATTGYGY